MFVKTLILLVISNNLAFQQVSSAGAEASVVTVISRQLSPVFTHFPASTETTAEVYDHVFDLFMFQGHPTAIFGKISVRKTIWELEFSEHLL